MKVGGREGGRRGRWGGMAEQDLNDGRGGREGGGGELVEHGLDDGNLGGRGGGGLSFCCS